MTYRTNSAPAPATRPAPSWWQRIAARALGTGCTQFRWYRRILGGRWARSTTMWEQANECPFEAFAATEARFIDATMRLSERGRSDLAAIALSHGGPRASAAAIACSAGCRCEVYPYPSLYSAHTAEEVRTFEEFREWYEGVRVVDLSRVRVERR